jgi:hypothetical protein
MFDSTVVMTGKSQAIQDLAVIIEHQIKSLHQIKDGVTADDVVTSLLSIREVSVKYSEEKIRNRITAMLRKGLLYSPKNEFLKVVN